MITLKTKLWKIEDIEAIFFDKDGTLIDSHVYWGRIIENRSKALIQYLGLSEMEHEGLCRCMGFSLQDKKLLPEGPIALVSREKVIEIVCNYLNKNVNRITKEEISEIFVKVHSEFLKEIYDYIVMFPGVREFLEVLKSKRIKMAVITTDSVKNTYAIMKNLDIEKYFNLLVGKETTDAPKISGIPARFAIEKLGVDSQRTVCIGDAPMDVQMSRNAGCKACIGVALGQIPYDELVKETPYVAKNYYEIIGE